MALKQLLKLVWGFSLVVGFEVAVGALNIGTGAVNTQYSVTGKTPASGSWKAVVLFWSGRTETTDASSEADIKPGFGVAVSSSARWAVTAQSDHSPTTMATDQYHTNAACVATLTIAGVVDGLADFVSFNSDGFTLIVDDAFSAALEVSYILLGGSDLTDAACGNFQMAAATGNTDYTGLTSFQPDFAIFANRGGSAAPPNASTEVQFTIGAATASGQALLAIANGDAIGTSETSSYCLSGECSGLDTQTGAVNHRASLTSFLSDGFRINRIEGTLQYYVHYLALKGGSYAIGSLTSATNTTAFTDAHGMSVTPKGGLFFSANRAESTADTGTADIEWSVGASDGTNNAAQYVRDKNASANADCFCAVEHNECYINGSSATTQAIEGLGHVNSFDSSNINFQMSDADPSGSFVWYALFGDTPVDTLMGQAVFADF